MFLPPDEENYEYHGIKNLVVKYSEFGTTLKLDPSIHQQSDFCLKNNIDIEEFIQTINEHAEPLKDQAQSLDRFSLSFLFIGFIGTLVMATVFGYIISLEASICLFLFYLLVLAGTFYRYNRQLKIIQ